MPLLNADKMFQTLLLAGLPSDVGIASDLDVDSFADAPFFTHSSNIAQTSSPGVWQITLTVNGYLEPGTDVYASLSDVYDLVHSWGETPWNGCVPHVGNVETVEDLSAFSAISGPTFMTNKQAQHFVAQFNVLARYVA